MIIAKYSNFIFDYKNHNYEKTHFVFTNFLLAIIFL